jgi:hypothetical protein
MRAGAMAIGLMLAGCAATVPVERQVVVSGERFAAVQGEASLFVRTFLAPVEGDRREVVGATCRVASSLYTAELVTPARLVLPNFGPQSPELEVSCMAGEWSGSGRVRIVTRWSQPPNVWGPGPYWGPGWGWDPWGWPGPAFPVSDYPDLNILLR